MDVHIERGTPSLVLLIITKYGVSAPGTTPFRTRHSEGHGGVGRPDGGARVPTAR